VSVFFATIMRLLAVTMFSVKWKIFTHLLPSLA